MERKHYYVPAILNPKAVGSGIYVTNTETDRCLFKNKEDAQQTMEMVMNQRTIGNPKITAIYTIAVTEEEYQKIEDAYKKGLSPVIPRITPDRVKEIDATVHPDGKLWTQPVQIKESVPEGGAPKHEELQTEVRMRLCALSMQKAIEDKIDPKFPPASIDVYSKFIQALEATGSNMSPEDRAISAMAETLGVVAGQLPVDNPNAKPLSAYAQQLYNIVDESTITPQGKDDNQKKSNKPAQKDSDGDGVPDREDSRPYDATISGEEPEVEYGEDDPEH